MDIVFRLTLYIYHGPQKKKGYNTEFIELASKVNLNTTAKIFKELKKIIFKQRNKKILIIGLSYKKNIEDTRESAE